MSEELPYRAEYAKSGRAACKGCKSLIPKDSMRLAIMVQSPFFDGKVPNWFHFDCFFGRTKVKSTGDIAHYTQLRWDDQQKLKSRIDGGGDTVGTVTTKSTKKSAAATNQELKDFSTEYAKSSRSMCRECNEKILKDQVRIAKIDYESDNSKAYGPQHLWHHVDCFVKRREEFEFFASADKLPGFKQLNAEDQTILKKKLPVVKNAVKRPSATSNNVQSKKQKVEAKAEESKLEAQNKQVFKYRDQLQQNLKKKDLEYLLSHNGQDVPSGESRMLDRLSDCMAFGSLLRCKECKKGQFVYNQEGYLCQGNMTEWTKCTNVTKEPGRKIFKIPKDLIEEYDFLKKYKCVVGERLFPTVSAPSTSSSSSNSCTVTSSTLPLSSMKFAIVGKLSRTKNDVVKKVESLGGKVVTKIDEKVAAVISAKAEVTKMSKKIVEAKTANVHVVSEDYLDSVQNGGAILLITEKSICDWGSDPHSRVSEPEPIKKKSSSSESKYTKSVPKSVKMTVKGGAAVDPDSELEDVAHVLQINKDIYNAVLGLVDVSKGTNSFYKLQILEADKKNTYWVFRAWGRVGTTIGGNKVEKMATRDEAIKSFSALYLEKTGNEWNNRSKFEKHPGRFYPLDIDYGQDDENVKRLSNLKNSKSSLAQSIHDLIRMLFDIESMKKALVEFEIDLKKMPLGKLSRRQIESAYSILTELLELIKSKAKPPKFVDASNRFYTLIPHDFGMQKPTPLDNEEIIKQKTEMLDNLLEIEVAYNLMKGDEDSDKDPIDAHYEKLKTDIEVVDRSSEEYERIQKYVKNTHAATHSQYSLEVVDVFKIKREGEAKRFKPFKKLHNRQLLWHGSRVTNFAGILSQGLRIAPPEAPCTGYMFGKGIYFADMVSKSANYCCTSKMNPLGLMMLCEVALGNMHELTNADFVTQLPAGKHSTKGMGRTEPNPSEKIVTEDGVEIPLGAGIMKTDLSSSLLYNEYIVYDISQVNIKYLLKMKFNWRY